MTKNARRQLTPLQHAEANELRAKIKILKAAKHFTSATVLRRRLRALLNGWDDK